MPHLSGKHDWFSFRMEVELIDAIRSLDESTDRLSKIGLAVALAGVFVGIAQLVFAFIK